MKHLKNCIPMNFKRVLKSIDLSNILKKSFYDLGNVL